VLITASLLPFLWPAAELLIQPGGPDQVLKTLGAGRQWVLLGHSVALAAVVTLIASLLGTALGLLLARTDVPGRRSFAVSGLRGSGNSSLPLGRWRTAASAGCWLMVALSVAPITSLALRAQRGGGFAAVPDWMGSSLGNSLLAGSLAATGIVVTGLVVGHGVARRRAGAAVLDALTVLAFVAPAVLLGIGLIALWNRPATAFVYGGVGMIVVGYIGRYAVVGLRTLTIIIAQSSPHLEESAAAAGAGYLRRLTRIVAPLHWRGVLVAWLLALVFCLRDFETAVLFYPPGGEPLTVRIFTLEANGPEAVVAALAVVQTAVTAGALAIGGVLLRRRSTP